MIPKGMEVRAFNPGGDDVGFQLFGTPEQAGTFTLTFNFSDQGAKVTHAWTLVVEPAKRKGADLSVKVEGPETVAVGAAATYTVVVHNEGPEDATSVRLGVGYGDMKAVKRVTSTRGTCAKKALAVECSLATLKSGAFLDVRIRIEPAHSGHASITGDASSSTTDPDRGNNKVTQKVLLQGTADIAVVKSGPRSALRGHGIEWVIRIVNKGPDWTEIRLDDDEPNGVDFTKVFTTKSTCIRSRTGVACGMSLEKGAKETITIQGTISIGARAGSLSNVVTVDTDDRDPHTADNKAVAKTRLD